jgi:hypothetical protein
MDPVVAMVPLPLVRQLNCETMRWRHVALSVS